MSKRHPLECILLQRNLVVSPLWMYVQATTGAQSNCGDLIWVKSAWLETVMLGAFWQPEKTNQQTNVFNIACSVLLKRCVRILRKAAAIRFCCIDLMIQILPLHPLLKCARQVARKWLHFHAGIIVFLLRACSCERLNCTRRKMTCFRVKYSHQNIWWNVFILVSRGSHASAACKAGAAEGCNECSSRKVSVAANSVAIRRWTFLHSRGQILHQWYSHCQFISL